jgi:hypothetical protein
MAAIAVWVCRRIDPEIAAVGAQPDASHDIPSSAAWRWPSSDSSS